MKPVPSLFLTFIASSALAISQDEPTGALPESSAAPAAIETTARILGEIPDGTPQPPAPPKPEYKVEKRDVLATSTHEQAGRTITIRQIKPIDLPPPPQPARASAAASEEFAQRLAEFQKTHPRAGLMLVGATVYRSKARPPRTLIHIWPEGGGKPIELWSSLDMALVAGGINSFQDSAGNNHHLMIAWSNLDIDRLSDLFAAKGKAYAPPDMPDFTQDKASFEVIGDRKPADEDLTAIKSLHEIYNNDQSRLQTAYEAREKARIEQEAYRKAHPPQPKDITLNYWRTEKAVTGEKGAAR
jgi:hypothetical protein